MTGALVRRLWVAIVSSLTACSAGAGHDLDGGAETPGIAHETADAAASALRPPRAPLGLAGSDAGGSTAPPSISADAAGTGQGPGSAPEPVPEGMALVPAGPFLMGADAGGELDEHPLHTVTLPAFYLDLTELPNEAYARCVQAGACRPLDPTSAHKNGFGADTRFRSPRQPISSVGWDDARAYCAWVHKRLPTEAEWEKAARGEKGRTYPWGEEAPTAERATFGGRGVTSEVGTHPAGDGPYGHHDLAGNVWEWMDDVYDPLAYRRPGAPEGRGGSCDEVLATLADLRSQGKQGFTGSNPIPTECEHVLRGGAFNYDGPGLRSSNRVHHPGRYHLVMSGFRCAKDARRER